MTPDLTARRTTDIDAWRDLCLRPYKGALGLWTLRDEVLA
jgi:hypothetical protein